MCVGIVYVKEESRCGETISEIMMFIQVCLTILVRACLREQINGRLHMLPNRHYFRASETHSEYHDYEKGKQFFLILRLQ